MKNITARIAKGNGIVRKIITILDRLPFGQHYFELETGFWSAACRSMLKHGTTYSELDLLETIDVLPRGTPKKIP